MAYYENYKSLAQAVVMRAGMDYRLVLTHLQDRPNEKRKLLAKKRELEKFFKSPWCYELSGISGDWLIKEINKNF